MGVSFKIEKRRMRRPPSLPPPCGVFAGLSSFSHFERDSHGPDMFIGRQAQKPFAAQRMVQEKTINAILYSTLHHGQQPVVA
jgi:hypothetical protein